MKPVTLFISTGRCGTQWLTNIFSSVYADIAYVCHEPLSVDYQPRQWLRCYNRCDELLGVDKICNHLESVRQQSETSVYIDTGWPAYAAIPLYYREFGDQLRLVHLVRNPIKVAASLVTHEFYLKSRNNKNGFAEKVLLNPSDPNIIQKYLAPQWDDLSAFQKCLFYWAEINLYGLEIEQRYYNVPFLRIKSEDLFSSTESLKKIVNHVGLEWRCAVMKYLGQKIDRWSNLKTYEPIKCETVFNNPQVMALALRFGYSMKNLNIKALTDRYTEQESNVPFPIKLIKKLKSVIRFF